MLLSVIVAAWYSSAMRMVPTSVPPVRCVRKKKVLDDYLYDLGDCMFCQLCTNACNFDAIEFTNDFENAVFDRSKLVLHLDKEVYKGGSLPNLLNGGAAWQVGTFNTKTK